MLYMSHLNLCYIAECERQKEAPICYYILCISMFSSDPDEVFDWACS